MDIPVYALVFVSVLLLLLVVFIWRLLSALLNFRKDLVTHQQDDCKRLDELHDGFCRLEQHAIDLKAAMAEIKTGVTEKLDQTIARFVEHRDRNAAAYKELNDKLESLLSRVATLEGVAKEHVRHENAAAKT